MSDTPETDTFIGEGNDGAFMTEGEIAMCEFARKLERERDEAREAKLGLAKLSTEQTWGKICEANALCGQIDELQKMLPDDTTLGIGIERLQRENAAMRRAIKEVAQILRSIQLNDIFEDTMRNHAVMALAKLAPFLPSQ